MKESKSLVDFSFQAWLCPKTEITRKAPIGLGGGTDRLKTEDALIIYRRQDGILEGKGAGRVKFTPGID